MRGLDFLRRWFALRAAQAEAKALLKQVRQTLTEIEQVQATIRDMRCPNCGARKCSDES